LIVGVVTATGRSHLHDGNVTDSSLGLGPLRGIFNSRTSR
jgi:hypothetical protein